MSDEEGFWVSRWRKRLRNLLAIIGSYTLNMSGGCMHTFALPLRCRLRERGLLARPSLVVCTDR